MHTLGWTIQNNHSFARNYVKLTPKGEEKKRMTLTNL